jgi:drug/metabolite transporter (DMT)-like permease
MATAAFGVWLLHDRLSATTVAGIGLTTAGFVFLVVGARPRPVGIVAAVAAGLLTSTYTWVDAQGVRAASAPITFIAWFFVCDGLVMSLIAVVARRRRILVLVKQEGRRVVLAGDALGLFKWMAGPGHVQLHIRNAMALIDADGTVRSAATGGRAA